MGDWVEDLYTRTPQKHCMICSDGWGRPIELKEEWVNVPKNEYGTITFWQDKVGFYCPICGLRYKRLEK